MTFNPGLMFYFAINTSLELKIRCMHFLMQIHYANVIQN